MWHDAQLQSNDNLWTFLDKQECSASRPRAQILLQQLLGPCMFLKLVEKQLLNWVWTPCQCMGSDSVHVAVTSRKRLFHTP